MKTYAYETITVNPPVAITGGSNIITTFNVARSTDTFTASYGTRAGSGGSGKYTFTISGDSTTIFVVDTFTDTTSATPALTWKLRVIAGAAVGVYNETVTVTDSVGETATTAIRVTVNAPIVLTETTSVIYTTTGRAITWNATSSTGGTPFGDAPVHYSITGHGVPGGHDTITATTGAIYFDSSVAAGIYVETITATDSVGATAVETMTLYVNGAVTVTGGTPNIYTTPGFGKQSAVYTASGGTWDGNNGSQWAGGVTGSRLEFTLNVTSNSGSIAGIRLDTTTLNQATIYVDSSIAAKSSTLPGLYYETLTITDSLGMKTYAYETITVNPIISVTGGSNVITTNGVARSSDTFTVTGGTVLGTGGNSQYTFVISGDSTTIFTVDTNTWSPGVPSSATLSSLKFRFTVVANAAPGTYNETVTVTDNVGETLTIPVRVTVNVPITLVETSSVLYTTYKHAIIWNSTTASGGTSPLVFSETGTAHAFITLDTRTAAITLSASAGAPNVRTIYYETITATDSVGATAYETLTIYVNPVVSVTNNAKNVYTTAGIGQVTDSFTATGGTDSNTGAAPGKRLEFTLNVTSNGGLTNPSAIRIDTSTFNKAIIYIDSSIASNSASVPGIYYETITITDSLGETTTTFETVTVNPVIAITGGSNVITTTGTQLSSDTFTATYGTVLGTGGSGQYTFAISGDSTTIFAIDTNTFTAGVNGLNPSIKFRFRVLAGAAPNIYNETVTVTDSVGETATVAVRVTVNVPISLQETVTTLYTTTGKANSWTFTSASGGTAPINFSLAAGNRNSLLSGHDTVTTTNGIGTLSIDSSVAAGTYIETLTATDSVTSTKTETVTIVVNALPKIDSGTANIYTTQGIGTRSAAYLGSLGTWANTGGTGNLQFTLTTTSNGATGTGAIRLDTSTANQAVVIVDSSIVSKDSATNGIYYETITITDSLGMKSYAYETITVNPPVLITGGSNVMTTAGTQLSSDTFTVTYGTVSGNGGTGGYTFVISGDSTTIFAIDTNTYSAGTFAQAPSIKFRFRVLASAAPNTYNETVTVTDSLGESATVAVKVTVNIPIALQETVTTLYTTAGRANSWTFTSASGGTAPITFSLVSGTRNAALSGHDTVTTTNNVGTISIDSSVAAGTYIETLTATDSVTSTKTETVTIVVNALARIDSGTANIYTTQGISATSAAFVASQGTWSGTGGTGNLQFTLTTSSNGGSTTLSAIRLDTSTANQAIVIVDSSVTSKDSVTNGIYYETLTVTDSLGMKSYAFETITVNPTLSISGLTTVNSTFDTGSVITYTFNAGTGIKVPVISGQFASGITWDTTSVANQATLKIAQFMPLGVKYETISITDSVGATTSIGITINFLKGNRSLTETAVATTIKYGDTTTVSGVNYANVGTCSYSIGPVINGYTYVEIDTTSACTWPVPTGVTSLQYVIVGAGGGGADRGGGGGGAGDYVVGTTSVTPGSLQSIRVGKGGSGAPFTNVGAISQGLNGESTTAFGIIAIGGGGGGNHSNAGKDGGSGGGAGNYNTVGNAIGYYGHSGASGTGGGSEWNWAAGGGGGAGSAGTAGQINAGTYQAPYGGAGGSGINETITGNSICLAAGGGGAVYSTDPLSKNGGQGGSCGSTVIGGFGGDADTNTGGDGVANTGSGGGGGAFSSSNSYGGGAGGSGVVLIRFAAPAPYVSPLVDGKLTFGTTTPSVCSVDTNTGAVSAYGSIGTCSIVGTVTGGVFYNDESTTINLTVGKADTITVTAFATPNTLSFTNAPAAITDTFTITGLKAGDTVTGSAKPITFKYSAGTTCATGGLCSLGQTGPGGGIVFYDAGTSQSWGRYLEVAPTGWSGQNETNTTGRWCSINSYETATLTGIGDGYANTLALLNDCGGATYAAGMAHNYTGGGYQDWYVPSSGEATALMQQDTLTGMALLTASGKWYWTSTQTDSATASAINPNQNNLLTDVAKSSIYQVRPIRAFDTNILPSTADTPTNVGAYTVLPSALVLANNRLLSNYQGVNYVSDTNMGTVKIGKVNQATLRIPAGTTGVVGIALNLTAIGGSSSKATVFKLISGTGTATGCTLTGSQLTATSAGTCQIYAIKAGDQNYYPTVSAAGFVSFDSFTARVVYTTPQGGGNMILNSGPQVLDTSTPIPFVTMSFTSFTPTSGTVGTVITITGTGFNNAGYSLTGVRVGRSLNSVAVYSVTNGTTISATVDANAASGRITLFFTESGSVITFVSPTSFSYTPPVVASAPTISSFTPTSGLGGTQITITGNYFSGTTAVSIGGNPVDTFTVVNNTTITATTRAGSASGTIQVTNAAGSGVSSGAFTSYVLAPIITLSTSSLATDSVTAVNISVAKNTGSPAASYNLLGTLPAGLTFNTSTGAITGTATEALSTTTYTVEAINPVGTGTATFTLSVNY